MTHSDLETQYQANLPAMRRMQETVADRILRLVQTHDLTLGVPIECRIKSWESIEAKLEQKSLKLNDIFALHDLIGVRLITLFRVDTVKVRKLISNEFQVCNFEKVSTRLGEAEFGYQSDHFVLSLSENELGENTVDPNDGPFVELQIRSLAQHIWAAASHKLQYKSVAGVPRPVRRAINRVSALLETVDIEFDRILEQRKSYIDENLGGILTDEPLNVDSLAALLNHVLPQKNAAKDESYADLLSDLRRRRVSSSRALNDILTRNIGPALERDGELVNQMTLIYAKDPEMLPPEILDRYLRHAVLTHVGLVRAVLKEEFGSD